MSVCEGWVAEGGVDYLAEAWGIRSALEGSVAALPWSGGERWYQDTGSLEKTGAAEAGEGTPLS